MNNSIDPADPSTWEDAWWAEPLDYEELRSRGFTYEEISKLEKIRRAAIPKELTEYNRKLLDAKFEQLFSVLEEMKKALFGEEEEEE